MAMNQDWTDFAMTDYAGLRTEVSEAESMLTRVIQLTVVGIAILVSFAETRGDADVGAVLYSAVPLAALAGLVLSLEQLERVLRAALLGADLADSINRRLNDGEGAYPESWLQNRWAAFRRFAGVFTVIIGFQVVGTALAVRDALQVEDAPIVWAGPAFAGLTLVATVIYVALRYMAELRGTRHTRGTP
jgi:hypothetical protein